MDTKANDTRKRILILEDDQDILEMLESWLSTLGFEAIGYNSVNDIVELTRETAPGLVLLDYLLGGINGGEYCAQLKQHAETRHIPVIMLTAHQRVIESLGHYGWDAFVAKPFDLDELYGHIARLISTPAEARLTA